MRRSRQIPANMGRPLAPVIAMQIGIPAAIGSCKAISTSNGETARCCTLECEEDGIFQTEIQSRAQVDTIKTLRTKRRKKWSCAGLLYPRKHERYQRVQRVEMSMCFIQRLHPANRDVDAI